MANIKQQKKRVGIAARQRLENLRYKSTAKTLLKSLQDTVNLGDKEGAAKIHVQLVKLLDRAASKNAIHANTASRKKARAYRVLISDPVVEAKTVRRAKKKVAPRKPKAETGAAAATTTEKAKKATTAKPKSTAKPAAAKTEDAPAVEETEAAAPAEAEATQEAAAPEAEATEAPAADEAAAEESTEG